MSEFELGILRQRAQEAYRQKVFRGEILTKVPVGYLRSSSMGGIEMTPDREVQEAIRGVFFRFERLGTLRQVLLWYHQERVALPVARLDGGVESVLSAVAQLPVSAPNIKKSHLCGRLRLGSHLFAVTSSRGSLSQEHRPPG
jgi:hypothetical protein